MRNNKDNKINMSVSIDNKLFKIIEEKRGDVSRSRFVNRILKDKLLKGGLKWKRNF